MLKLYGIAIYERKFEINTYWVMTKARFLQCIKIDKIFGMHPWVTIAWFGNGTFIMNNDGTYAWCIECMHAYMIQVALKSHTRQRGLMEAQKSKWLECFRTRTRA